MSDRNESDQRVPWKVVPIRHRVSRGANMTLIVSILKTIGPLSGREPWVETFIDNHRSLFVPVVMSGCNDSPRVPLEVFRSQSPNLTPTFIRVPIPGSTG